VKVGTIYKNHGVDGIWSEYEVTEYIENKVFTLSSLSSSYHVRYTYTAKGENLTELEYFEWMDEGELDDPFKQDVLDKLKEVMK
jgi:hypothetical protein